MAKYWEVTVPIAGHASRVVEADTEEEAIELALETVTMDDIDNWESLRAFHDGSVCYCSRPWEAEATFDYDDDEEA